MKPRTQIILTLFFPVYLAIVLFTNISLTGFWTDIIFSILFSIYLLRLVFKNKTNTPWLTITLRISNTIFAIIIFGLLAINLINPFIRDVFKMRSFYFQRVEGRLFNAYFKPVGAYSGGYGNFWINESPIYFPLIEWRVYYDRTVDWNFNDDTFDGNPVDNYRIVRSYIKDKVIDKKNDLR